MYRLRLNGCVQAYRLLNDRGRRFRASCDDDQRTVPCRGSFARGGVTMRDCSKSRAGFDRVLMAVAATFLTVTASPALAHTDPPRSSAAELAIDAAIPRPEPANVPPPTASDFKPDATASVPDAAQTAPSKAIEKAAAVKPADVAVPASGKTDTATTTPASPPAAATATPAAEPVKAASNVPPADQPVADKLRDMLGGKSLRYFDRKAERSAVEKFYTG